MKFVYVHGFASSPQSRKAMQFRAALAARDVPVDVPAMDRGDFEHLTISGQLEVLEDAIRGEPVCLIGSSMGGYLASLYAAAHPEMARLVLLAPAFGFARRWDERIGAPKPAGSLPHPISRSPPGSSMASTTTWSRSNTRAISRPRMPTCGLPNSIPIMNCSTSSTKSSARLFRSCCSAKLASDAAAGVYCAPPRASGARPEPPCSG